MDYYLLRAQLWRERADYSLDPPAPRCEVCGTPLRGDQGQCHHVLRRGVVMGWPREYRHLANDPRNCLLVCSEKCHRELHADPARAVQMLIKRYGRKGIRDWIQGLPFKVRLSLTGLVLTNVEIGEGNA